MCVINLHMDYGMSSDVVSDVGFRTWDADGLGPATTPSCIAYFRT